VPHNTPDHSPQPLAFAALIAGNIALAFGPWFVRLTDTGPVSAAFWRVLLATPLLIILTLATSERRAIALPRALWLMLAFSGLCFAGDLGSWHVGILKTTLANATLFGNCATLFYPVYGFIIARALPTRIQGIALLLAAIGAALLIGHSYQLNPRNFAGDLLCLFAGLLYTTYFICMARIRAFMAPMPALTLSTIASIVPLLAIALLMGEPFWPHHWTPLIGLALVSQVFGQGCMIYALGRLSPLVVGLALLTQPVVAATVGWLVYNERLGPPDIIGALLVAIALVLVRERKREPVQLAPVGAEDQ
jgi:drug/metabolite transporter (DMT)-like permease